MLSRFQTCAKKARNHIEIYIEIRVVRVQKLEIEGEIEGGTGRFGLSVLDFRVSFLVLEHALCL